MSLCKAIKDKGGGVAIVDVVDTVSARIQH